MKRLLMRSLVAVCVLALMAVPVTLSVFWHQGYRVYVVRTGSMTPTYSMGSMVIDRPANGRIAPGDVITFSGHVGAGLITHRVVRVKGNLIQTKGDANKVADPAPVSTSAVIGKVVAGVNGGGYVLVFLKQPSGVFALMAMLLCLALLRGLFVPASELTTSSSTSNDHALARATYTELLTERHLAIARAGTLAKLGQTTHDRRDCPRDPSQRARQDVENVSPVQNGSPCETANSWLSPQTQPALRSDTKKPNRPASL